MTRLDHNRALTQIALKTGTTVNDVSNMTIWGNHSATQYPDLFNAGVNGKPAIDLVDQQWYENDFIPTVQQRGPPSSRRGGVLRRLPPTPPLVTTCSWALGTTGDDWGSRWACIGRLLRYCRRPDLLLSCRCEGGQWQIVQGAKGASSAAPKWLRPSRNSLKNATR